MLIAGLQKMSMMDYPGHPCAVVFTPYCNMACSYCHNYHILGKEAPLLSEASVWDFLEKRRGLLDAVVVSGGEPTLQQQLRPFIERLKELGFLVKLDTNGTKPTVLAELLSAGLLDYVAMDIKAGPSKYDTVTCSRVDLAAVRRSIFLIRSSGIDYEFRTTFAPELDKADIVEAAELIQGAKQYYIQQYRKRFDNDPQPHLPSYVREAAQAAAPLVENLAVRGL